jgi:cytochrome c-type biogenesis protein CcmH
MAAFWILAALMALAAVAIILVPMLRSRALTAPSRAQANLDVLRGQRQEIEADVMSGLLSPAARDEALRELLARADGDLEPQPGPESSPVGRPWIAAAIAAVFVPVLAFGMYAATGNPAASDPARVAATRKALDDGHKGPGDGQIAAMVETLAAKVRERPGDVQGWTLLARSMASLGRFKESAEAYDHLAKIAPGDADVLADYADALGMAQGGKLAGRPTELANEALRIDPKHSKALALAGTAALDRGDFAAAIGYWQRLAAQVPPDSADHAQVQGIIDEVRTRAAASGKPLPATPAPLAKAPAPPAMVPAAPAKAPAPPAKAAVAQAKAPAATADTSVTGSVALAPSIASQVTGTETLFIFARSEGGPRVPLAVVRTSAGQLPMRFALDDTQAMAPGMNLSSATAVRIEARISKSGSATPQPGDLVGASGVVKPGAREVNIVVDKVLP